MQILIGIVIALHGLVHLWYFSLSRGLVEFKPEMGWSGQSWLFSNLFDASTTRLLASGLYILGTVALVISAVGIVIDTAWWRPVLAGSAILSSVIILLFWDGKLQQIVEKGFLGLLINIVILAALLLRP